jgi:hypothetical protein
MSSASRARARLMIHAFTRSSDLLPRPNDWIARRKYALFGIGHDPSGNANPSYAHLSRWAVVMFAAANGIRNVATPEA